MEGGHMQFPQNQKLEDKVNRSMIYILSLGTSLDLKV